MKKAVEYDILYLGDYMAGNTAKTKQVIIMREDLDLSPGKIGAQAAHASLSAVLAKNNTPMTDKINIDLSEEESEWFHQRFTKIVLGVKNEEELLELHKKALDKGLNVSRPIVDAGFTELEGPTLTCIAIGPNYNEDINELTGHLRVFTGTKKQKRIKKYLKKRLKSDLSADELKHIEELLS